MDQESAFLSLPTEVQMLIFASLDHAPSQVSLALTCKHMARISACTDLSRSYISKKYAGLLPRNVFDVPELMRTLGPWTPSHLTLCHHCLTMRPKDPEYWVDVCGFESGQGRSWVKKAGWTFAGGSWQKQLHDICPACHLACTIGDYNDCDGCKSLGRLGDVDWSSVTKSVRRTTADFLRDAPQPAPDVMVAFVV